MEENMRNYLFVHFRETTTPDGEQVYFALSRDGFHWEALNEGQPVLWAYYGDHGVRDMTITRDRATGKFHIFATDLSLSYGMRGKYKHSWDEISRNGSKCLAHWQSDDLVHWTEEELIPMGEEFGCVWAPDILYDEDTGDYVLHWSSSVKADDYQRKAIYYSRTRDFKHYSKPQMLYSVPGIDVIDSAMYRENGKYYLFVKKSKDPQQVIELVSDSITGPFTPIPAFNESLSILESGKHEAPTAVQLADGRWALFLDYYGVRGAGQGYVPFLANTLESGKFTRSDAAFFFPYNFKHGTILTITDEEYARMKARDWKDVEDRR